MSLTKTTTPETAGLIVDMRAYAAVKAMRDDLILQGLAAGMPVWRIADEMDIDRKTIFTVRDKNKGEQ